MQVTNESTNNRIAHLKNYQKAKGTLEKVGNFDASANDPEIMNNKSLIITVNLMNVFKSSDSKPRDLIKVTQSGFILLALTKHT